MPFQFTVLDAKNSGALKAIAGVCSNSNAFLDLINEVQRRLLKRGDWYGTTQVAEFCTTGCNITWPRWVGAIEGVRFGHHKPGHVFNNWYRFIGPHHRHSDFHSDVVLEDAGTASCYNDISGTTGKLIRYYVVTLADIGKKITLFGKRYGAQPLQENDPVSGLLVNGLSISADNPYGTDATMVTHIEAITREATVGMAYLYEYDPVTQVMRDLARFEPNETNPRYRRSCIINPPPGHRDSNGVCWRQVEALIKLEFQPVVNDRDFLLIDDFDALKLGIQAVKLEEANDDSAAEVKWLKAIRELNFRDRDKLPDDSIPVRVISMSGHTIRNPQ